MSGWPVVALGKVAALPRTQIQANEIVDGTMYVGLEHIESGGRILDVLPVAAGELASAKFVFEPGDILYGKLRPYLAKITVPGFAGVCSTDILPIRVSEEIDARFLLHYLRQPSLVEWANARSTGANLPRLSPKELAALPVPLPPIEEQRRIAAILDHADALRAKRREALARLDELTQSIFIDMFGDPVSNAMGWKSGLLADLVDAVVDCAHSTPKWTESGEVCLRTSNLSKGGWDWADTRYVSPSDFDERSRRGYLEPGDIVLSREGTVGIAAIVPDFPRLCMGQRLVQVKPGGAMLTSEYLLQVLLFELAPERISRVMIGSTSSHLNVKDLRALRIAAPPIDRQREFARRKMLIETLKEGERTALTELDALFSSLQSRAFRGEL